MPTPFPIDPFQTAIAIAYKNKRLIADDVFPRVPVGKESFRYAVHKIEESFTVPDTKVGRRSKPNEVSFSSSEETESTEDHGLDDPIPNSDLDQQTEYYDPLSSSTEYLTDKILLGRELRVASIVFDSNSYPSASVRALTGQAQWSDFENSDPVEEISEVLDSMIMRANVLTIGRKAYSKLSRHPMVVKAVHGNSGDSGIASRGQIADLFELEKILVGEAFVNSAKKGQPANLQRAWGDHCSFTYQEALSSTTKGMAFGFTGQYGGRVSGSQQDGNIGLRGGLMNRVGESVKEVVSAPDCGYLLQNVIASS